MKTENDNYYLTKVHNGIEIKTIQNKIPEILFITSISPRECGIATYSKDLIDALNNKYSQSYELSICALESKNEMHTYSNEVKYILNTDYPYAFQLLAKKINNNPNIEMVLLQHEFGFFEKKELDVIAFMQLLKKPIIIAYHTVLPEPNYLLRNWVEVMSQCAEAIIVMTQSSEAILVKYYDVSADKIKVIQHGTHLVANLDREKLKAKYRCEGRRILSTFGLLSSGKSIETTLNAMPAIIKKNPSVLFLIIGKTHPSVVKQDGENYRQSLESKIIELQLENHVQFVNQFLPLPMLLEYLQLTDIYLFTSKDRNQAVSGTFSYALSCGCPIVSTPIPHALEVLKENTGVIVDFESSTQLTNAVNHLLNDETIRTNLSLNGLHRMAATAWENSAIMHSHLFNQIGKDKVVLKYNIPSVNLDHIKRLTTDFGMIQFSRINQPDLSSGYTLDDNARALIAVSQHFDLTHDESDLKYIRIYFNFIKYCLQSEGYFLNYVNETGQFTEQNNTINLGDANGRAIWALGFLLSIGKQLPSELREEAELVFELSLQNINKIHSTRAMAFIIKGLYYHNLNYPLNRNNELIKQFANRLVQMFKHESEEEWYWFESYLTYGNSLLPEALLCSYLATGEIMYKAIAKTAFDFLLSKIFNETRIQVISNKTWLQKGAIINPSNFGGEQPIDVAYTILALSKFYDVFKDQAYLDKMEKALDWFLGNNHLRQIIYNPCTGGCYDGLEENYVNLNQGAESTVSYLMARLTIEKYLMHPANMNRIKHKVHSQKLKYFDNRKSIGVNAI
jgi:glycosyltransferase involved in cell wall biosynthesis